VNLLRGIISLSGLSLGIEGSLAVYPTYLEAIGSQSYLVSLIICSVSELDAAYDLRRREFVLSSHNTATALVIIPC
jgi:hypothetical protein